MGSYRETDELPVRHTRPVAPPETTGATPAARTWGHLVEPGMYVAGLAGDVIGQVKEVRSGDFLVDRSGGLGLGPSDPVYVPFERIHAMLGDRITLDLPSSQVDEAATRRSPFSSESSA